MGQITNIILFLNTAFTRDASPAPVLYNDVKRSQSVWLIWTACRFCMQRCTCSASPRVLQGGDKQECTVCFEYLSWESPTISESLHS